MNRRLFRYVVVVALLCSGQLLWQNNVRAERNLSSFPVNQFSGGTGSLLQTDSLPHVASTLPTQNELTAIGSTNISVTFDVNMDPATINDSTFVVYTRYTGRHQGTISYSDQSRTATFDLLSDFKAGELVTVVLTTGIKSSGGIPLDSSYIWSFNISVKRPAGIFAADSTYPVSDAPRSVCSADLDGDGNLDLATAGGNPGKVTILLNNGNGTFAYDSVYTINWYPYSICASDLDADGDIDLVTAVEEAEYMGNITILLNNGDGTFGLPTSYPIGSAARSVCAADLDGDGDLDLAVGQYFANQRVSILLNNGDGTFIHFSDCPVDGGSYSLYPADLDGDKDLDLATVNGFTGSVSVLLNDGLGNFVLDSSYASGYGPFAVFAADLDADSDNDLAAANHYSEYFGYVSIFLNNGDGKFTRDSMYWTSPATNSIFAADLDGDSDLDLAGTDQLSEDIPILLNNGDGRFTVDSFYAAGLSPTAVVAADLDNDGDLDLVAANSLSDNVSVLLNSLRVDPNGDAQMTIADVVYLVNYLFKGGPPPQLIQAGDANCDTTVTIADAVYLISYLFKGGPAPRC